MEDLKREFEGEPEKLVPTHEVAPPKRPEKRPLHEGTEAPPTSDQKKASHSQPPPNTSVRRSNTAPPVPDHETLPDAADVPISETHSRSAEFTVSPNSQPHYPPCGSGGTPAFGPQRDII